MPPLKKITSVSTCTICNSVYEGIVEPGQILPCGHEATIFAVDTAIVEALQTSLEPERPASKANVMMLIAFGRAMQIRRMSTWLGYILIFGLTMLYYAIEESSFLFGNLFLASSVACVFMETMYKFPSVMITGFLAGKICPPKAYARIQAYVERDC
ncbi:hypothetical protein [Pseudodesulfovibrio pelocollis]|uniref:hypothetical protein n=1 Tax=Pseudodesulfovibrio pelocollis TaxID=3051432 RepID=UPI00255B0C30|nr:hypothetical protein [Pseudodesulfovibrio sp. SB368]